METGSCHPTDLSRRHSGESALVSPGLPDPMLQVRPLSCLLYGPPPHHPTVSRATHAGNTVTGASVLTQRGLFTDM